LNIYEIPAMYREIVNLAEESDDESLQEAVGNAISEIKDDLKNHAENLGKWMSNLSAENVAAKAEIERLKALVASRERRYNAIKSGLLQAMVETNTPKISTGLYAFSLRKGSESADVIDVDLLPIDFVDVQTIVKAKKADIKKQIKKQREEGYDGELLITEKMARITTGDKTLTVK